MKTAYLELSIIHYEPGDNDNTTGKDEYHLYFTPLNLDMSNKRLILIDVFPTYEQAVNYRWQLKTTAWKDLGGFLRAVECENYCYSHFHHLFVKLAIVD